MILSLIHIISIIAIFQSIFLSIFLLNYKNGRKISNKLFASILFIFAILIICSFTQSNGIWEYFLKYHKIIFIILQFALLINPFILLYVKSILDQEFSFKKKYMFHFLPFFIMILYLTMKIYLIEDFIIWDSPLWYINSSIILLQNLIYLIVTLRFIFLHRRSLQVFFNTKDRLQYTWLLFLICGFIFIWLIQIHSFILADVWHHYRWCTYTISLYSVTVFLFINAIAYITFMNPALFIKKYQKSSLDEKDKKQYTKKLIDYIEKEKPFLNSEFSMTDLSKKLSITTCYLSQIINGYYSQHFHDFINKYRIEESKKLMRNPLNSHKSILELAYEVGFNSKSAFNRAFKKHTNITPSEFKKNNPTR